MKRKILLLLTILPVVFAQTLTWEDCVKYSIRNNPELKSTRESVTQSQYSWDISRKGYLPTLSGSYSGSKSKSSGTESDSHSAKISLSQTIYDGFKNNYASDSAKNSNLAAKFSYENTSASLRNTLRIAYINILKYQEQLAMEEIIKTRRKKQLELITLKYDAGREHMGARLNAEASFSEAFGAVIITNRNLNLARKKIAVLLDHKDWQKIIITGSLDALATDMDEDMKLLASEHPYARQLKYTRQSKEQDLSSTIAESGLNGDASLSYGFSDSKFVPQNEYWSASISFSHPLWNWGLSQDGIKIAESKLDQAKSNEQDAYNSVRFALEEAWVNLLNSHVSYRVQDKYLLAIEERAKIADVQYSTGQIAYDTWIQIENDLVVRRKSYLSAKVSVLLARTAWVYAKGGSLEDELI